VQLAARVGSGDLLEEGDELGVTVARLALVSDPACGDLERGEQRGRAMP
jgi:hypothetical protein